MNPLPIREQFLQAVDRLDLQQQEQLLRLARQTRRQMRQQTPLDTPGEVLPADVER